MSKLSLEELNLQETLSSLLLPYVYVLPQFKSISIALGVKFEKILNRKSKLFESYISSELSTEYERFRKPFEKNIQKEKTINKFIISGGFLPYQFGQTNKFNDIDIYIEHDDFEKKKFRLEYLRDSLGQRIWIRNRNVYSSMNRNFINYTISLNKSSKFYRLIKETFGEQFHPPQLILYTQKYWKTNGQMNKNIIPLNGDYYNLDSLMIDAYNILDVFDLPICRNALLFLDEQNYCSPFSIVNDYKRIKCYQKKINVQLIDHFRSDSIILNFRENTNEEYRFLHNHLGSRANSIGFGENIYAVGLKYQTGPYRLRADSFQRLEKYKNRCILNSNKNLNLGADFKLNYEVPRLDWLAYKKCQHFNLNSMVTCFCNLTQYYNQYKRICVNISKRSTFLKTRLFEYS